MNNPTTEDRTAELLLAGKKLDQLSGVIGYGVGLGTSGDPSLIVFAVDESVLIAVGELLGAVPWKGIAAGKVAALQEKFNDA